MGVNLSKGQVYPVKAVVAHTATELLCDGTTTVYIPANAASALSGYETFEVVSGLCSIVEEYLKWYNEAVEKQANVPFKELYTRYSDTLIDYDGWTTRRENGSTVLVNRAVNGFKFD